MFAVCILYASHCNCPGSKKQKYGLPPQTADTEMASRKKMRLGSDDISLYLRGITSGMAFLRQ